MNSAQVAAKARRARKRREDEIEEDEEVFEFEGLGRSEHGSEAGDLVVIVRRRRGVLFGGRR